VENAALGEPLEQQAFEYLLDDYARRAFSMNPFDRYYWIPTPANRANEEKRELLRNRLHQMIIARRAARTANPESSNAANILDCLLKEYDEDHPVPDEDLVDQLMALLFAGLCLRLS
jgi:cytochrome P450